MKKLILFTIVTTALAFAASKAAATGITITGMATFNYTNYMKGSNDVATTVTKSVVTSFIFDVISNAVAHASNGSNDLAATLPKDGEIEYYPEGSDGKYKGYFYVTDPKGDSFYPLSGIDANGKHFSFMDLKVRDWFLGELGPTNSVTTNSSDDCCCCCCCCPPPRSVYGFNISEKTDIGSYFATDVATLMVHSDPYWQQRTNPQNELTLIGTFEPKLTFKDYSLSNPSSYYLVAPSTATFNGMGDLNLLQGSDYEKGVIYDVSLKFNF